MKLIRYNTPLNDTFTELRNWFREPFFGGQEPLGRFALLGERFRDLLDGETSLAADLYEDDTHYHVRVELPGVRKEEIAVTLEPEGDLVVKVERATGEAKQTFVRRLTLPKGANAEAIQAKLENGLLTVSAPKTPERKALSINIS